MIPTHTELAIAIARDRNLAADRDNRLSQASSAAQQKIIREDYFKKRDQLLADNEKSLVARLAAIGIVVSSVWDLVNTRAKYTEAVPLLAECLHEPYHPAIREGIARALTVPEAAGMPAKSLLRALRESTLIEEEQFRWACANALTEAATSGDCAELEELLREARLSHAHGVLALAIKKARRRPASTEGSS